MFGGSDAPAAATCQGANARRRSVSFEARRDEIGIMALVGAPVAFIRGPFVVEGAVQGALGALAALGGLALLGRAVSQAMGPLAADGSKTVTSSTELTPTTEPMEMSMPPVMMTSSRPRERMALVEICRSTFMMF